MPFISDTASAVKSRFGFHGAPATAPESVPVIQSTPDLFKSASRDNLVNSSSIRSIRERGNDLHAGASGQSFELSEDPSFWKDHNVQAIIRIRPLSSFEISLQGYSKCVRQDSCQTITWTGHPESRFTFDAVADENVSQEKLFNVAGLPMVDNCMGGYNSCMFAYGQTGSGKTHTMLGDIEGGTRRHSVNCGMIPRVFEYLFTRIQKEKEARRDEKLRFTCKCSFLEIYNEQILDLLDPSSTNLQIREDTKKGVYVDNLKEIEVTSARDVIQQLVQGAANRKVAATNMNHASSRSHSVFTCTIESKWDAQGVTHHRFARLNLVDLAGSERQKSSGAEGDRLKEATNINKSLSTLGLVIMNLVNISNGKSLHVPYRDSKLTFLLQDSLGGNSKTTIIANISPSNSCSLETLSTLKFAQRAKFIKNNAIVNEDASGDVLAMRIQIQQLKKEVSHLRGLVNGEENQENDTCTVSFPGSPGGFKWEGLHGSFSPLTTDKRIAHKKDYDVALVGAFRRERDKEFALQALAAENQAAMQLTKQREDEIQGLKMRLRLREAGIKRLETVASGKISGETHLLKEREEHLKEIEMLRAQVDRNQEVTRFAMENLRLKEEIRRLKSFHEEGEREMLNEQITSLQNKLLEALDWKLMHESDPLPIQNGNPDTVTDLEGDCNLQISGQLPASPWRSSMNEENEFLRMQAIQNQAEMDALRKKFNVCLEEKEKLERRVNDLVSELEKQKACTENKEEPKFLPGVLLSQPDEAHNISLNDQIELKTMVDAIATASQREAEAHETAIILSKENDELRMKLKVLIEDNNKLIELYERAVTEVKTLKNNNAEKADEDSNAGVFADVSEGKKIIGEKINENLENQLMELHEENEKLMSLYEKAMQERDEFKRLVASGEHRSSDLRELNCPEKLVEVDEGECFRSDEPHTLEEGKFVDETGFGRSNLQDLLQNTQETEENEIKHQANECLSGEHPNFVGNSSASRLLEDMDLVRMKLEGAYEKLSSSVKVATLFGSLEKAFIEVEKLSCEIKVLEDGIQAKQQEYESVKLLFSALHERRSLINSKLMALKYSLSNSSSSVIYFEEREEQARSKVNSAMSYLEQKKQELSCLRAQKNEIQEAQKVIQQSEVELRDNLSCLKLKLEEGTRRQEKEKVLFAIDNVEKTDTLRRNLHFGGKAIDLLRSEEEKIKLQSEMNKSREKLGIIKRDIEDANGKYVTVQRKIQVVEMDIEKGLKSVEQMELGLQNATGEKDMLLEYRGNMKAEVEGIVLEYLQSMFEADLKNAELKILEEELQIESDRIQDLHRMMAMVNVGKTGLMEGTRSDSLFLSEKMEEELQNVQVAVLEAKSLLDNCNLRDV